MFGFGFAVIMLSLANAELFNLNAGLFVPVALGTGAPAMLIGGLAEFRRTRPAAPMRAARIARSAARTSPRW